MPPMGLKLLINIEKSQMLVLFTLVLLSKKSIDIGLVFRLLRNISIIGLHKHEGWLAYYGYFLIVLHYVKKNKNKNLTIINKHVNLNI